jgi:plastocyanin
VDEEAAVTCLIRIWHRLWWLAVLALVGLLGSATATVAASGFAAIPGPLRSSSPAPAPTEKTVRLVGLHADPDRLEITTGTTVSFVNSEPVDYPIIGGSHQVVADNGSFGSPRISPGARWAHRFTLPGTYSYYCTHHPFTVGTIVVTGRPVVEAQQQDVGPPVGAGGSGSVSGPKAAPAEGAQGPRGQTQSAVAIAESNPSDPMTWGFRPADLVVDVGTTVMWRNTGEMAHTVTANDGSFDSGNVAPGGTWSHRFDRPGVILYYCTPHPWMKAVVRVAQPGLAPPAAPVEARVAPVTSVATVPQPQRQAGQPQRPTVRVVEPDPATPRGWGFAPAVIEAQTGDTVAWRNTGRMAHTITADSGAFDSGMVAPGATWERHFTTPGTYAYHCAPHPWMRGVVKVTGTPVAGASAATPVTGPGPLAAIPVPRGASPFVAPTLALVAFTAVGAVVAVVLIPRDRTLTTRHR